MPRLVALVCASIALLLALDLRYESAVHQITGAASSCVVSEDFDCDTVQSSEYAKLLGVSVSMWAAAGSALLIVLLLLVPAYGDAMRVLAAIVAGANGVASLVYLGIAAFALGVNCLYCNGIQLMSIVAAVCVIPRGRRAAGTGLPKPALGAAAFAGALTLVFALVGDAYAHAQTRLGIVREDFGGAGMRVDVCDALPLGDPQVGTENSFVVYFCFGCPRCKAFYQAAARVVKEQPERAHFFFKHWPLDRACNAALHRTVHENSCRAARAGTVLGRAGHGAGALHDIFDIAPRFSESRLAVLGARYGIPEDDWTARLDSKEVAAILDRHVREGNALDFGGVPAIYRNGHRERELRLPRK